MVKKFIIGLVIFTLVIILPILPIIAIGGGSSNESPPINDYVNYNDEKLDNRVPSLIYGTPNTYVSSPFDPGRDIDVNGERIIGHTGTDFPCNYGDPIKAGASGVVIVAGFQSVNGNYIRISHNKDVLTYYGHMSNLLVVTGDRVTQGQKIGECGSTGASTGNHLHYELNINRVPIDILPYLIASNKKGKGE